MNPSEQCLLPRNFSLGRETCDFLHFQTQNPNTKGPLIYIERSIYRNKISCAYWLLSVNCLLGSHYLNEGVSHHRQISSLLNRILAPFTCHQENSSITTLRASLPTTIIIHSDVFLVDGFLHICPPSEDSLFVARGSILFMPESPDAAQIEW